MMERETSNNRGQTLMGLLIIGLGALFLAGNLLGFNPWAYCWPAALIGLGVWLMLNSTRSGVSEQKLIGDIKREGVWEVANSEYMLVIGDVILDLTQARIPAGITTLRTSGMFNEIKVIAPPDVGVQVVAEGMVNEVKVGGWKKEEWFERVQGQTANYDTAERKVRVESSGMILDIKVKVPKGAGR